ncbi:MAG: alkane 1-monooxygenase [Pseudomonadota bacterium]
MAAFAAAALSPLGLFGLALWVGGLWVWAAFLYMAVLVMMLDQMLRHVAGDAADGAEFPCADALLAGIGLGHLVLLPLVTWGVAGPSGLTTGARVLLFFGAGLWMGQVAHPAAHELIHRGNRWLFRLGVAVYVSLLFGQHASAHRLVHHRHVASADDPNTARSGEGFYRFALRAWRGSFVQGWRAETALRARGSGGGIHPYAVYIGGALAALGLAWVIAGAAGVLVWAGLALHAQSQLLVSDYVQHYGLVRAMQPDGRLEPVGPRHSWNAGAWFSSAMMLNAPRHSDHHAHPTRPYPALRLPGADLAPRLPWPLPVACAVAFVPGLWRRAMRKPVAQWKSGLPHTGP